MTGWEALTEQVLHLEELPRRYDFSPAQQTPPGIEIESEAWYKLVAEGHIVPASDRTK